MAPASLPCTNCRFPFSHTSHSSSVFFPRIFHPANWKDCTAIRNLLIDYHDRHQGCANTLQKHIQGLVSKLAELCYYFLVWGRGPLWTQTHTHTGKSLMSSQFTKCSCWHAEWLLPQVPSSHWSMTLQFVTWGMKQTRPVQGYHRSSHSGLFFL